MEIFTEAVETEPGVLMDVSLSVGTFGTTMTEEDDDCMTFDYPKLGTKYGEKSGRWSDSPFPKTTRGFGVGACFGVTRPSSGIIASVEYNLFGTQYAWIERRRVVLVTPIKRWCQLLVERGLYQAGRST